MKPSLCALLVSACFGFGAARVEAALVLTSAGFPSPAGVVTFDQFAGLGYNFTAGPVDVGGLVGEPIIMTLANASNTNNGVGAVLGQGSYGLADNGFWGIDDQTYFGVDGPKNSSLAPPTGIFTFSTAVSAVGGFLNYAAGLSGPAPLIEALGVGGVVLESYDLASLAPISTPGGVNAGGFRGIQRASNDILAFRVSGTYLVMDDLTFARQSSSAVPEPSTVASLGLAGLIGLAARFRRRLRAAA